MSRGGYRWGRPRLSVELCHSLSAWGRFQWVQEGGGGDNLEGEWREESGSLVLDFKRDGGEYRERIGLTETSCYFGGSRSWLVCPQCGRRVGKVYLPTNLYRGGQRVQLWLCRRCWGLTYEQRRAKSGVGLGWVLHHRAERLLARSGVTIDKRGYFQKPGRMREKTFARVVAQYEAVIEASNRASEQGLGSLLKRLSALPY